MASNSPIVILDDDPPSAPSFARHGSLCTRSRPQALDQLPAQRYRDDVKDNNSFAANYQESHDGAARKLQNPFLIISDTESDDDSDATIDDSFEEWEEEDDGDNAALLSMVPAPLAVDDDDLEIVKVVILGQANHSTDLIEIDSVHVNGATCRPGKCVELTDGTFIRIHKIVKKSNEDKFIIGQLFKRQNLIGSRWPRRHNELVQITSFENGQDVDLFERPISLLKKVRRLIITNQSFPTMSSRDHPDTWQHDVKKDIDCGPLFCRWISSYVYDGNKGKVTGESIRRLLYHETDPKFSVADQNVRKQWRGFETTRGGERSVPDLTSHGPIDLENGTNQYVFADMFCGCGGASCGAKQAGLFVRFGADFDGRAMATYELNYAQNGTEGWLQDIHDIIVHLINLPGFYRIDVLHISPPCQCFSPANTVINEISDIMNKAAFLSVVELIQIFKPRIITLEETWGLPTRHPAWFDKLLYAFLSNGYSFRWMKANLAEWGVPQARTRLLLIGAGPGENLPSFPAITHSKTDRNLRRLVTINDVLHVLERTPNLRDHDVRHAMFGPGRQKPPHDGNTQAKTITCAGGQNNYHPSGLRKYTVREFATLQGFPLNYKFPRGLKEAHKLKQIGNAVPPPAFKLIFEQIIRQLKEFDEMN